MLEEMREAKRKLDEIGYDLRGHRFFASMGTNGTKPYPETVNRVIDIFRDLTTKGVLIKDMNQGLIDFPAIGSDGHEVYLCYMLGEETINFFHGVEDGFAGRRSVEYL